MTRPAAPTGRGLQRASSGRQLDELCAANGFSRLDRLTTSELALVAALDAFEQRASAQRKAVYDELDVLTDELVVRCRAEQAGRD